MKGEGEGALFARRFTFARQAKPRPPAFVLVAVLVIVMLLSMLVISLLFRFQAEDTAASASLGSEQAWAAAMSGVEEALRVAATAASGATDWQDNPAAFRERLVFEDGGEQWYFSVFSPGGGDALNEVRHGLTDEASKLNVNYSSSANLEKLPRVSPTMAAALMDFLDADDLPEPEGAEQEYYSALARPYTIRNGPLASLDELLLVRGFTAEILHGAAAAPANATNVEPPTASANPRPARGLSQFLTVASYDLNTDADGWDRTNLNDPAAPLPATDRLPAAVTNFIFALQTNGVTLSHPADLLEATLPIKDAKGVETELASGVGKAELAAVLELFTATDDYYTDGLINVNTASATVLATLPGVDEALAETIVSARGALGPDRKTTIAWLYQEGVLDAAKFKTLAPLLTARSAQFTFQVIGYGLPSGRFRVLEAGIDVTGGERRVTYLRDVTRRGLPFTIVGEGEGQVTKRQTPARGRPQPQQARGAESPSFTSLNQNDAVKSAPRLQRGGTQGLDLGLNFRRPGRSFALKRGAAGPIASCRERSRPFPLTPALSRRERENRIPRSADRDAAAVRALADFPPLPAGEGRGEGEGSTQAPQVMVSPGSATVGSPASLALGAWILALSSPEVNRG